MRRLPLLPILAGCLLASGCLPATPTREGRAITDLYAIFVIASIGVGGLVWGLATWNVIRYRRRADEPPEQVRGDARLEVAWTAGPILLVLFLFAVTLSTLAVVGGAGADEGRTTPAERVELRVTAFRWGWRFEYPATGLRVEGVLEDGPVVVLPIDRPVHVTVTATDVIHAFYVPVFLFKRDAIPGRESSFDFTIDEPGRYGGQCAEFCGVYHASMSFTIEAVDGAAFDAWLAGQPAGQGG